MVGGVNAKAFWLAGGLVDGGSKVTMGCVASGLSTVVLALELSSSSTTTWELICFDNSLDSRLSEPS